jgi:hypothetical protein
MNAKAKDMWDAYVTRVTEESNDGHRGFQSGCEPKMWESTTVSYRGVVLAYHGLTACTEQYDELGPMLAARGFVVLAPVVSGHGLDYDRTRAKAQDDITELPHSTRAYQDLAKEMISIVEVAGGESAVYGLSLGGSLASYTAYHSNFDRRLITVPFIKAAGVGDKLLSALEASLLLANVRVGWGEDCEERRVNTDRAGYCPFTGRELEASRDVGAQHLKAIQGDRKFGRYTKPADGSVAMMFVDGNNHTSDGAVAISGEEALAKALDVDIYGPYFCGLEEGIPHSYLSRKDNYGMNMYWLNEVLEMIADYLADGIPIRQEGQINGRPRCMLKCTGSDPSCQNIPTYNP